MNGGHSANVSNMLSKVFFYLFGVFLPINAAAAAIQLPQNPLHFPSTLPQSSTSSGVVEEEEDGDADFASHFIPVAPMTLHVMTPGNPMRIGRQTILSTSGRSTPAGKVKAFFDELINISPQTQNGAAQTPMSRRPRLVYIRDFPTLAASASVWYPPLLSSVRQYRQGPMARPSSPVTSPMTIVFGVTPPINPPARSPSQSAGPQGMLGLLMSRSFTSASPHPPPRLQRNDYGEDEASENSRERRLRERLRKWERGDPSLQDEIPMLPANSGGSSEASGSKSRPEVLVIGQGGLDSLSSSLPSAFQNRSSGRAEEPSGSVSFFRSTVLVPESRSRNQEKACRVSRRREINELTMRMGIGAVGGALDGLSTREALEDWMSIADPEQLSNLTGADVGMMWNDWGNRIESWEKVRDVADRAVGAMVASGSIDISSTSTYTLDPTPVPWSAVVSAWVAQQRSHHVRKSWVQESITHPEKEPESANDGEQQQQRVDEVIQQLKNDPELSTHEQRLLGCIVDSGTYNIHREYLFAI